MRNNIQNDVKVENPRNYASKFNLSGSVSNTNSLGRVGVAMSRLLTAGTKAMCAPETLVQTAPLVSPCYAKQYYKQWHMFVPIEDVFKNYTPFMTSKPVSRNGSIIYPDEMPKIKSHILTLLSLTGAKCSIYLKQLNKVGEATAPGVTSVTGEFFIGNNLDEDISLKCIAGITAVTKYENLIKAALGDTTYAVTSPVAPTFTWTHRDDSSPVLNIGSLMGLGTFYIDSGNVLLKSFIKPSPTEEATASEELGYDVNGYVDINKADFTVFGQTIFKTPTISGLEAENVMFEVAYCFRLSSWGQALYKLLCGLGYPVDLNNDAYVSVLPLFATYKAYWDIFGLNMWQNFESTYCGRLITAIENLASADVWDSETGLRDLFWQFIYSELGAMWVTEKNDYITGHLPQPVIGEVNDTPVFGVADVQDSASGYTGPRVNLFPGQNSNTPDIHQPSVAYGDGHAKTRTSTHGALDSEILKRMYKATNRQTAYGQWLEKQMISQGLGEYLQRSRTNYIGDFTISLDVSAVTSTSDTYQTSSKDGRPLGSRAGKCVGYGKKDRKLFITTPNAGWWICLDAVTCDSGWSQGADLTNKVIKRTQMYQPDYDGLGLKIDTADVVCSRRDIFTPAGVVETRSPISKSWGFAPRFSEFKVGRNCTNGGFALKSLRDYYLTYNMDKQLFIDDIRGFLDSEESTSSIDVVRVLKGFSTDDIPIAGNAWRFLNRYPWMSNLARIFTEVGESLSPLMYSGNILNFLAKYWEYHYLTDDNYIVQTDFWFKAWSKMLPIEETYGTIDPDQKALEYVERV